MPVVPFTSAPGVRGAPSRPPADEPFVLMAAATMHSEGRLVEPQANPKDTPRGK